MYVGVSRAKKQCIVIGTEEEFHRMCKERAKERRTLLRFYLYLEKCGDLEALNEYKDINLMPSKDFRILPSDQLGVPVPPPPEEEAGEKKKKKK